MGARSTVLLVHGGRHGGWCWDGMLQPLRAAGLRPMTPSLTGLAERRHLLAPSLGLEDHVRDLVEILDFEDLRDAIVVAHSYGGVPSTVAADRRPDRVGCLVYLDAIVPGDGQCLLDTLPAQQAAEIRALVEAAGDGWRVPGGPELAAAYGVADPQQLAWAGPRITDQPFATYCDPVALTGGIDRVPRGYIRCARSGAIPADFVRSAQAAGWPCRTIDCVHDAMITDPGPVTDAVSELVAELRPNSPGGPERAPAEP